MKGAVRARGGGGREIVGVRGGRAQTESWGESCRREGEWFGCGERITGEGQCHGERETGFAVGQGKSALPCTKCLCCVPRIGCMPALQGQGQSRGSKAARQGKALLPSGIVYTLSSELDCAASPLNYLGLSCIPWMGALQTCHAWLL